MEKDINVLDLIRKNQFSIAKKRRIYYLSILLGDFECFDHKVVFNYVLSSDSFKKCIELYKSYIFFYGTYLQTLAFSSAMEATFFIEYCLFNGFFSVQNKYEYHDYLYEPLLLEALFGARVLSGHGVCCHTASFYEEILRELGYATCYLSCKSIVLNGKHFPEMIDYFNHALPGIMDDQFVFAFDYSYDELNGNIVDLNLDYTNESRLVLKDVCNILSYIVNEHNIRTNENINKFREKKDKFITNKDILIARSNAMLKYVEEKVKLEELKKDKLEVMMEIVRLEGLLSPHSDEPLRKLNLRARK